MKSSRKSNKFVPRIFFATEMQWKQFCWGTWQVAAAQLDTTSRTHQEVVVCRLQRSWTETKDKLNCKTLVPHVDFSDPSKHYLHTASFPS